MSAVLDRIAAALERLAPPPSPAADLLAYPAYVMRDGRPASVAAFRPVDLSLLVGLDRQRDALLADLRRLAAGHAAHDVLLWGARGAGKSALVKAGVAAVQGEGGALALVEATAAEDLPALFARLAPVPRAFAVLLDDLGFADPHETRALRSALEGGAEARPANVRLLVTSNRRHLMPRDADAEASAINPGDGIDDGLALADRFGLRLGFHALDQTGYLAIVRSYCTHHALPFDPADAIAWATQAGARSGRVARQYVVEIAGRAGRSF